MLDILNPAADASEDGLAGRLLSPPACPVMVVGRILVMVSMLLSEDVSDARDWTALIMGPTSLTIKLGATELVAWLCAVAGRRARRSGRRKCMIICYHLVPGNEIGCCCLRSDVVSSQSINQVRSKCEAAGERKVGRMSR